MTAPATVTTELVVGLVVAGSDPLPVTARFGYREDEPYAVTLHFLVDGDQWVTWTFARSLLDEGLTEDAGEGDVSIWPGRCDGRRCAFLHTSSPHGAATFVLPLAPVVEFLLSTYALVPSGLESEQLDLDAELAALLG